MTPLRTITAAFYAGSLGYALATRTWWQVFVTASAILAWLPSVRPLVLVLRTEHDNDA